MTDLVRRVEGRKTPGGDRELRREKERGRKRRARKEGEIRTGRGSARRRDKEREKEREGGRGAIVEEGEVAGHRREGETDEGGEKRREVERHAAWTTVLVSLSRFVLLLSFARERGG